MFLFRLGKEKLSFTLRVSLQKIKYSHINTLNSTNQIEIDVERGSHRIKILSQINKKGQIRPDKEFQSFPMTLYFDKSEKKFEKKQMIIKGKVLDDLNQTVTDLGQAEMDISEYAQQTTTENLIQVELYGNKDQICKLILSIKIQRNNDGCFTETETLKSEEVKTNRSRNKNDGASLAAKKDKKSLQVQGSELEAGRSVRSNEKSSKRFQNTLSRNNNNKNQSRYTRRGNEQAVRSNSINKLDFEQASEDNQTVQLNKNIQTPPKMKLTHNFNESSQLKRNINEPSSVQLTLFQTQRALRQKNKELIKVKRELQAQKKISQSLLNQQRKMQNVTISNQTLKQMQALKTQLMVATVKLGDLQAENRKCNKQLDEAQLLNERQAQQLAYYKNQLQKEKVKMAEVFQMALERGDNDLISFLEELAQEQ